MIFLDGHVRSSRVGGEKDSYFSDDVRNLYLIVSTLCFREKNVE